MPITIKKVTLPSPGPNDQGNSPSETWTPAEPAQVDYAAPSPTRDPRDNSKDVLGLDPDESRKIPGSDTPDQPWKSPPAPPPRRLRRDS
jgi:hypothetical protein